MQQNDDYVLTDVVRHRYLYYQPHIFHLAAVLGACGDNVNSCGIDTAMAEDIRQFCNIFLDTVKYASKEMSQIMGKYLVG